MTPNQPYLLRAIHEWILDNNMTPHILVNAQSPKVEVPMQSVQDGQIVLNIATHAISNILMDNEAVSFSARFSGVVENIYIPVTAIKAIYASENGQGLVFPEIDITEDGLEDEVIRDVVDRESLVSDNNDESLVTEPSSKQSASKKTSSKKVPSKKVPSKKTAPFLKIVK
ncbi:MAG: stringent starvation protein B [Enterobacterales bacterium]|jgi:stringent starvation protein B